MITKPEFSVNICDGAKSSLLAIPLLTHLDPQRCHHHEHNLRLPLGIYNISIKRICDKIIKCSNKLESYFKRCNCINSLKANEDLMQEVVDYIELSLYAAAEHVDDIKLIARGFFKNEIEYKKSKSITQLAFAVDQKKTFISTSANAIKHKQSRIRLFSTEFTHANNPMCLHGFFIEGVRNSQICPVKILKRQDGEIFSITSLLWEILVFLLHSSQSLESCIKEIFPPGLNQSDVSCKLYSDAIVAVARLPLYSFDDVHPFSNTRVVIVADEAAQTRLDSGVYGSIRNKWEITPEGHLGGSICGFEGDGVSTQFKIAQPKSLSLQHWD